MPRVLLVSSVHHESGLATAAELQWLLGNIRPDVVFLEHPTDSISTFLDRSCGTLEAAALGRYVSRYPVELVPVDRPMTNAARIKQEADVLFDSVEEASPEFRHLANWNGYHTAKGGFAYLNSPICIEVHAAMHVAMQAAVEGFGDPSLTERYLLWVQMHDRREEAMLDAVESYARQTRFTTGVLLVGAGHIPSLLEKVQGRRASAESGVVWDIEWRLQAPPAKG